MFLVTVVRGARGTYFGQICLQYCHFSLPIHYSKLLSSFLTLLLYTTSLSFLGSLISLCMTLSLSPRCVIISPSQLSNLRLELYPHSFLQLLSSLANLLKAVQVFLQSLNALRIHLGHL